MDAYQNLISSDKRYNERKVIIADGSRSSMSILQHTVDSRKVFILASVRAILLWIYRKLSIRKPPVPQNGSIKTLSLIQTEKAFSGTQELKKE